MPVIIEADDLTKTYNDTVAVSHIRFEVNKGEIFGFLGPNGAGKTTTMRMIECISPRTSGTLRVFGMDPDKRPGRDQTADRCRPAGDEPRSGFHVRGKPAHLCPVLRYPPC